MFTIFFLNYTNDYFYNRKKNQTGSSFKKKKKLNKFGNVYKKKEKNGSTLRIFIKLQQWLFL